MRPGKRLNSYSRETLDHPGSVILDPIEGWRERITAKVESDYWRHWARVIKAYVKNPRDAYNAFWFLHSHPANRHDGDSVFVQNLWVHYAKVDPTTHRIEDDKSRNTQTDVWLEWGPWDQAMEMSTHDPRCDTGGATFERALINLAHNVWALYRDKVTVDPDVKLKKPDYWG